MSGIKRKIDLDISPYKFVESVIATKDVKDCTKREREVLDKLKAVGGIRTMKDLCQKTQQDLYGKAYITQENIDALEKILSWYGLHLGMHPKAFEEYEKATLITPELAQTWLSRNAHNRAQKDAIADRYAQAMRRGLWSINSAEPIAIDWNGDLANGQHRLRAVVLTGLNQLMMVQYDTNPADFRNIDTGRRRSPGDILSIEKVPDASSVSGILKSYIKWYNGWTLTTQVNAHGERPIENYKRQYFMSDFSDIYKSDPDLWDWANALGKRTAKHFPGQGLHKAFFGSLAAYLVRDLSYKREDPEAFFKEWHTPTGNPIVNKLRNAFVNELSLHESRRMIDPDRQQCVIKAWNAWVLGKKTQSIKPREGEKVWFIPNPRARKIASSDEMITIQP